MASTKQKPVHSRDVRVGHVYYMPVPAHSVATTADSTIVSVADNQPTTGLCIVIENKNKTQAAMTRTMLRDGILMYRAKNKAKRQALTGNWLRPWNSRELAKVSKK